MEKPKIARVLSIAGSDSGGGAGIQADIKTCAAFGVYASTAITAITAQNTLGVQAIEPVSEDMVAMQISSVLQDIGTDVIKLGMLANARIAQTVAEILETDTGAGWNVIDPVMVASSGDALLEQDAIEIYKEKLVPLADVLTPNIREAEVLSGVQIETAEDMIKAGKTLQEMGAYAVLMKGGHMEGKSVIDILITAEGNQIMSAPRLYSRHTHGTGCTLAAAIAAGLALDQTLDMAVVNAREFVFEGIANAPKLGAGDGPLNHGLYMGAESDDGQKNGPEPDNPFSALKDLKP